MATNKKVEIARFYAETLASLNLQSREIAKQLDLIDKAAAAILDIASNQRLSVDSPEVLKHFPKHAPLVEMSTKQYSTAGESKWLPLRWAYRIIDFLMKNQDTIIIIMFCMLFAWVLVFNRPSDWYVCHPTEFLRVECMDIAQVIHYQEVEAQWQESERAAGQLNAEKEIMRQIQDWWGQRVVNYRQFQQDLIEVEAQIKASKAHYVANNAKNAAELEKHKKSMISLDIARKSVNVERAYLREVFDAIVKVEPDAVKDIRWVSNPPK